MHPEWNLHIFRWVIDDGEPELHVDDVFDWFAISFWSDAALLTSAERTKSAESIADHAYLVSAEVIYVSHDVKQAACILDFGIRAISSRVDFLPRGCQEGDYVMGEVRLELPLCTAVNPHNLVHRWRVNRVSADVTPYVQESARGAFIRNASAVRYQDVSGTDSLKAKCYVLHCSDCCENSQTPLA